MKNQNEKDQKFFERILSHAESNKRLFNIGLTMYSVYRTARIVASPATSLAMIVVPTVGSIIIGETRNYMRRREENAKEGTN